MKQKLLRLFVIVCILSTGSGFLHLLPAQSAWNGTADTKWYNNSDDTFVLTTAEQLAGLASLVNKGNSFHKKTIILKNDLILNHISNPDEWLSNPSGTSWVAIGTANNPFKGTFDGGQHIISGLYNKTRQQYMGLFGAVEDAVIKNIGSVYFYLNGHKYNGGMAGYSKDSKFSNVFTKGVIALSGGENIGGLTGHAIKCEFESVSSHISILSNGKLESTGGLIGNCENGFIKYGYSIGNITAKGLGSGANVGGFLGYQKETYIDEVYTVCEISVKAYRTGAFAGYLQGTNNIHSSYYNTDKYDGKRIGQDGGSSAIYLLGKNSQDLRKSSTFEYWDFDRIWSISAEKNDGYPYLSGNEPQTPPEDIGIFHVKENGNDVYDGSSWAKSITLSKALTVINNATNQPADGYQIWIAEGNYATGNEAFHIGNDVRIYGGFTGTDDGETVESRKGSRDATILSGNETTRVITIYREDRITDVVLDGLTLTKGVANDMAGNLQFSPGETTSQYRGGGLYNAHSNTTLNDVKISGNYADKGVSNENARGGGIYHYSGNLIINDCLISDNVATTGNCPGEGGGVYVFGGDFRMHETKLTENFSSTGTNSGSGGGLFIYDNKGKHEIMRSVFKSNGAVSNVVNDSPGRGGAIYDGSGNLSIVDTDISQNVATTGSGNGFGGGIYHNGFYLMPDRGGLRLENSVLSENIAFNNVVFISRESPVKGFGGGIYLEGGSIHIFKSFMVNNVATYANKTEMVGGNGGAVYNEAGRLIVEASRILENTATNTLGFGYGGGISNESDMEVRLFNTLIALNDAGEQALGGGFSNTAGRQVTLTNVTIAGNSAGQRSVTQRTGSGGVVGGGSGIYNYSNGHISIENTIVWNNREETGIVQYLDNGASHVSGHCFISDLQNDPGKGDTILLDGKNRTLDYPKFVDALNHDYRLKAASPLRNIAQKAYIENDGNVWMMPDKDLDDKERINRSLDLGAYESSPFTVTLTNSVDFGYFIADSLDKYGVISATEYEIDANGTFEFSLRVDRGTVFNAVVKADGKTYEPGPDMVYAIPNIMNHTHIDVSMSIEKYSVTIPEVTGIITDSVPGVYLVSPGDEFAFSMQLKDGYDQSVAVVKANETVISPVDDEYRFTVTSNTVITIEGVKENSFTVRMPKVTGIITTPASGDHTVMYDSTFNFIVIRDKGYENQQFVISNDRNYPVETVDAASGKYRIRHIKNDLKLTIAFTQKKVHTVALRAISDIQTSPKTGQYSCEDGTSFNVSFRIPTKYAADDIQVELDGQVKSFSRVSGNSYSFSIQNIKKNHTIDIVKNRRYQINLTKTAGVVFNPSQGIHRVGKYDNFSFSITLEGSYDQSSFRVFANNALISPIKVTKGVYTYQLLSVDKDYSITVEGVRPNSSVGNEVMDGKLKVYSDNQTLFIQTDEVSDVCIITMSGLLYKREVIPAGTTKVQLPSGIYIIKVNDELFKIVI